MLAVTDAAKDRLVVKLDRRKAGEGQGLRFRRTKTGWRLRLDRARPEDTTFTHAGRHVLLLDPRVAVAIADRTLDVRQTDDGPRLTLR